MALLDRLLHHAITVVTSGDSFRMREARTRDRPCRLSHTSRPLSWPRTGEQIEHTPTELTWVTPSSHCCLLFGTAASFQLSDSTEGRAHQFGSIEDARAFCQGFFAWYNGQHRHSGIALFTPADVHYGRSDDLQQARAGVLAGAYAAHPERFVKGLPIPAPVPSTVWINPPPKEVPLDPIASCQAWTPQLGSKS